MPIAIFAAALAMFVAPIASGNSNVISQATTPVNSETSAQTVLMADSSALPDLVSSNPNSDSNVGLEQEVKAYYADTPILSKIAFCESTYRQYSPAGTIFRGKVNPFDVGLMQINEKYHAAEAKQLGYDLTTVQGNLEFAEWLYDKEGTTPWDSSKPCWGNSDVQ